MAATPLLRGIYIPDLGVHLSLMYAIDVLAVNKVCSYVK
jgi:hypothetical protein